jgi:hypothetical protein
MSLSGDRQRGLRHIDEALQAARLGPLPSHTLARLDAPYESDFT